MSEPLPVGSVGLANWQDYVNNWREADAEWLRDRTIMRFNDATQRDAQISGPSPGHVVYNLANDYLELRSKTNAWRSYRAVPANLAITQDDASGAGFAHVSAGGKGMVYTSTSILIGANLNVLSGVLTADATGITIKTGTKVVKLTTSTTGLVSDSPISAPSVVLTGTGSVLSAAGKTIVVGSVNADTGNITNIAMTGTLSGGVINGTSGTIGSITLSGHANAPNGFVSQAGYFYGDANSAHMQYRNAASGALGGPYVQVTSGGIQFAGGGLVDVYGNMRFLNNTYPAYYYSGNNGVVNIAPSFYSAGDPGAGNFPDGTIWIN